MRFFHVRDFGESMAGKTSVYKLVFAGMQLDLIKMN
jgi:hypothetical protein